MIALLVKIAVAATTTCPDPELKPGGLVPACDPSGSDPCVPDCNMDALLTLGENIVNTLITIAFIITTLFLIIGAFKMIISQGAPERISSAKSNVTSAIIGLVIVLVSWAVLNYAINFFVDETRCTREWWRFEGLQCELTSPESVTPPPSVPTP